ncbi:MAG TPA: hypothetical protein VKA06_11840, partial [Spirochaetia bacterium]|nr:hypothetical protein [Spirochaetia bacterium]
MNRLSLFLLVCTGLVFVGSGIQSSRADRLRAQAHALQPTGASLGSVEADLAGVRATVARMRLQSVDAAARPEVLSELADALAREVRRAEARLTRLSIEPD